MDNFDLKKYLNSNRLVREEDERVLDKKKQELKKLRDQVRAIQKQFGAIDGKLPVTGVRTKDDQVKKNYLKVIGTLPQQIKDLKTQIDSTESPNSDLDQD